MHDTLTPNVLKVEFSRKVIQIRALVALGNNQTKNNPGKKYQLLLVTAGGNITGKYCELFCSDETCCEFNNTEFDISKVDELANKVLIDAEAELVNIKLVDNAEFIKLTDVTIERNNQITEVPQLNIYADQIIAFSLIES
ncbi:hypothetical protein [Sphaerochaeta sp. S2]|uniref:hypothetical protein n=1 Tax=Sphaerochaeta sp. S2 TaxID=2798868 RepID=UPI0018E932AD|nr:hypothetical protein [Sphaerochaeta sp. S2]MBJ2357279.1 hypothetical protein [Sphaerochaeta sp. S2]